MKKRILIAMCLLAHNAAFSESFYGGLDIGYQVLSNTHGGISNDDAFRTYHLFNDVMSTTEGNGVVGGAFLGYDKPINDKVFLAVEANIEAMNNTIKQYDNSFIRVNNIKRIQVIGGVVTASENLALGVAAKPGLIINNNSRLYATLGYEAGRFKGSDFYVLAEGPNTMPLTAKTGSKWLNGFRYGVGAQMDYSKQLALRLEVNQTQYPTVRSGAYYNVATGEVAGDTINFKFKTLEATLGAVWRFSA